MGQGLYICEDSAKSTDVPCDPANSTDFRGVATARGSVQLPGRCPNSSLLSPNASMSASVTFPN